MGSDSSKMSENEGLKGAKGSAQFSPTEKLQLDVGEQDTVSKNTTQTKAKTAEIYKENVMDAKNEKGTLQPSHHASNDDTTFSDISETELSDGEEVVKPAKVADEPKSILDAYKKPPAIAMADTSDISETELSEGEDTEHPTKVDEGSQKVLGTITVPPPTKMDDASDISETELSDGEGGGQTAGDLEQTDAIASGTELSEVIDNTENTKSGDTQEKLKITFPCTTGPVDISYEDLSEMEKSNTSASLDKQETQDLSDADKTGISDISGSDGVPDDKHATDSEILDNIEITDIASKSNASMTDKTEIGAVEVIEVDALISAASCTEKDAKPCIEDMETTEQENYGTDGNDNDDAAVVQEVKDISAYSPIAENAGNVNMDITEDMDYSSSSVAKEAIIADINDIPADVTDSMSTSITEKEQQPVLDVAIAAHVDSNKSVGANEVSPDKEKLVITENKSEGSCLINQTTVKELNIVGEAAKEKDSLETIEVEDEDSPEKTLDVPSSENQKSTDGILEITEEIQETDKEIISTAGKPPEKSNKCEDKVVETPVTPAEKSQDCMEYESKKYEENKEVEAEDKECKEEIVFTAVNTAEESKKEEVIICTATTPGEKNNGVEKKLESSVDSTINTLNIAKKSDEDTPIADINIINETVTDKAQETISVEEGEIIAENFEESTEEKRRGIVDEVREDVVPKPAEGSKDLEPQTVTAAKPVSAVDLLIAEVLAPDDTEDSTQKLPSSTEICEAIKSNDHSLAEVTSSVLSEANESQESTSSNLVIDEKFESGDTTEPSNCVIEDLLTANPSKENADKETSSVTEKPDESVGKVAETTNVIEIEDEVMIVDTEKKSDDSPMIIEIDDDDEDAPVKTPSSAEPNETLLIPTNHPKRAAATDTDVANEPESATVTTTSNEVEVEMVDGEVFYNKTCINYNCPQQHKQYYRAPHFALSYFKVNKKNFKPQFICSDCCDDALDAYEFMCGALCAKQPLFLTNHSEHSQEAVNIIVSSDEENDDDDSQTGKEQSAFCQPELDLIEQELTRSIRKVFDTVSIQNQLTWSKTLLMARLKNIEEDSNAMDEEINGFKSKLDKMYNSLYQYPKIKVHQQQPIDGNTGQPYYTDDSDIPQIPPFGEVTRPPIQLNENYYAVKNKAIASWVPCKVLEQIDNVMGGQKNSKHYKIKYLKSTYQMVKTVSNKHMAYYRPPNVRLNTGERVIAYFDANSISPNKEKVQVQSAFYPGIIAEPLRESNRYRYLIFYDDGYTQYVQHKDVRLVCNVSDKVWEDVHSGSRDFIESYLTQHTINRPMVQTQKGQNMSAESNGKWTYARVMDIDCSLIQMQFETVKNVHHTEWIYRGSLRLGPVFHEHRKRMQAETSSTVVSRNHRRHEPYIRYADDEESKKSATSQEGRAVARKSLARPPSTGSVTSAATSSVAKDNSAPTVRHLNNSTIYVDDDAKPKGKVVYYTTKHPKVPRKFVPHKCAPSCLNYDKKDLRAYSPFSKPILLGWERMLVRQKIKKFVAYRGPCGKVMRTMKELRLYLRLTDNILNVDQFDFSPDINCLAEYNIDANKLFIRDISCGQEKVHIPLINYYDNSMPPECKYAAQRIPTEGVPLNLDEEFLVGCDCEDDCSDKSKCSCWQLTLAGARYGNPNTPIDEIGYQYKRLHEHVPTGIYECNSRCKCKSNCLNRVVQHSLEMRLQVFKTSNRGWGLRCLNDIPKGSFICIYAGHLLTEAKANEGGLDAGDEYFAELDYIEVAEQIKEGYESEVESDVEPEEEEEDAFSQEQDDDDEFTPSKSFMTRSKANKTRNSRLSQNDEDSQERQVINFNPNSDLKETSSRDTSMRSLFGKDEACYVMDAKVMGNLGRYFNHSCTPNLFVQNVFVDTHDLRFPWVAFFSSMNIRAGTELTWNYNYEVGVVPGKVLYCQCGTPNCRGRLL